MPFLSHRSKLQLTEEEIKHCDDIPSRSRAAGYSNQINKINCRWSMYNTHTYSDLIAGIQPI